MSVFHFQQFSVQQSRSGMKVCTDATLFGAMMPIAADDQVLDIGSGTGLLSLMAAQLGASQVTGVELTTAAWEESRVNCADSPWNSRMHMVQQDIRDYAATCEGRYNLIISNPPFFQDHYKASGHLRNTARHADQLPYAHLVRCIRRLLKADGLCYVLLPFHAADAFIGLAASAALNLLQRTDIRGYARNNPKVCALVFGKESAPSLTRLHTIYLEERQYSTASAYYLRPFLLRFANAG